MNKAYIERRRFKGRIIKYLNLGETSYDLNFFTNSGHWISNMSFSKNGGRLTIWLDKAWFEECAESNIAIMDGLYKAFKENDCTFPSEIVFKLIEED